MYIVNDDLPYSCAVCPFRNDHLRCRLTGLFVGDKRRDQDRYNECPLIPTIPKDFVADKCNESICATCLFHNSINKCIECKNNKKYTAL